VERVPFIRALIRDLEAAIRHDPAAQSRIEVLLAYPGVHALALHRIAHALWNRRNRLSARVFSHYTRALTGVEIHPGARIADGVFIDHGMGVVIGETAIIEEGCILYKGVVLGGTSLERRTRHPHLHRNVVVGSNACVLGSIQVGEGARIGSGSVGVPGRIVREPGHHFADELDHASLPDPVADVMRAMAAHQEALANRLAQLEEKLKIPHERAPDLSKALDSWGERREERDASDQGGEADRRRRAGSIF
jgi:serine O-acetyltransferase